MIKPTIYPKKGDAASNQEVASAECANIAKAAAMLCDLVDMDGVIMKAISDTTKKPYYYMYPSTVMELYDRLVAMAEKG